MNKLYCGDNLEIMQEMDDASVDLIYADPPFGTNNTQTGRCVSWRKQYGTSYEDKTDFDRQRNIEKGIGNNRITDPEWLERNRGTKWEFLKHICTNTQLYYFEQMIPIIEECFRVLKLTGACYFHIDYRTAYLYRIVFRKIFRDINCFGNEIIWHYPNKVPLPNLHRKFNTNFNYILFYRKVDVNQQPVHQLNLEYEPNTKKKMGCIWSIPYVTGSERVRYPTQKPIKLLERIIKASSNEGDLVLDPFCGSGTTLDAAESLGHQWIGIDQNPDAIAIVEERLKARHGLMLKYERVKRSETKDKHVKTNLGVPQSIS